MNEDDVFPTLVNTLAVMTGSLVGLMFHNRLSLRFRTILFQAIGLATLLIGLREALNTREIPLLALSLIAGALLGEWINIEERLKGAGEFIKHAFGQQTNPEFIDGFAAASLLFCVGAMSVVGSFRAGVEGNGDILYTKSVLDGHAAIFLAGAMGAGVMASALSVLGFQGGLTLAFAAAGAGLPEYVIREVGAAGGLLIVGISINLLDLGKVRVGNLLPAMLLAGILVWLKQG
ncbi:MAG: DUF554 domain-containing protein [bacterium]